MKKIVILFIVTLSLFNCDRIRKESVPTWQQDKVQNLSPQKNKTYKVIKIKDGDTVSVLMNGKEQTIRFAHIDCPERYQAFGNVAKQFVAEKSFGKKVSLLHRGKYDRYGRLIAEIILEDGTNLNKALVRNGLAWHFKRYSKDKEYDNLENQARKEKIGLWQDPNPISPWEWRKLKRKNKHKNNAIL